MVTHKNKTHDNIFIDTNTFGKDNYFVASFMLYTVNFLILSKLTNFLNGVYCFYEFNSN